MHVIYGGTFDPIHHGHLRLALEIGDRLGVDRVTLVPCHIPPHRGATGASPEQRLRLLELAIAGERQLCVDDRELVRGGASYTADTLRQLRAEIGPDRPLVMVVGTDAFAGLDRWDSWQQIPELAHIVVVRRPGPQLDPEGRPAVCWLRAGSLIRKPCTSARVAGFWSWTHPCWIYPLPVSVNVLPMAARPGI